ncbi:MAG: carbon-nitrogen hydrolase family protein [Dermatophilaceae bacterium]
MTSFCIAIAQPTLTADPRVNGRKVRELMRQSAAGGARLVQFPEGALSGYVKEQFGGWDEVDFEAVREEAQKAGALAKELGLWVVLGSAHRLTEPNRPHNSLYVISDQGLVVDRYDKRFCSHTEITGYVSPGFEPVVFDVDGFRFGCAICVEINFPQVFSQYEELGVDCLLLSAYPSRRSEQDEGVADSIFEVKARGHASINCYWLALSAPQQTADLVRSGLIGPNGALLAQAHVGDELVIGELDRDAKDLQVALTMARPWRTSAIVGDIYRSRQVADERSTDRACL